MIIGSLGALYQKKVKRLMAYSGIANVGLLLMAFALGSIESIIALIIFMLIYIISSLSFFSFILGNQTIKENKLHTYLVDFTNFGQVNPVAAFSITLLLFSMVGLPPLAAFFGKLYIFLATIHSEFYGLAIFAILATVLAAFYYIRIIKLLFFESKLRFITYKEMDSFNSYILSFSLFFLIFFFACPHVFLMFAHKVALTLSL
jgi:NADH-quinone oxidoreductase subunit N